METMQTTDHADHIVVKVELDPPPSSMLPTPPLPPPVLHRNPSEVYARFLFNTRYQEVGESVDEYFAALFNISCWCNYQHLRDGLIRDRMLVGVRSQAARDTLLRQSELTLQSALDICRQAESQEHPESEQQTAHGTCTFPGVEPLHLKTEPEFPVSPDTTHQTVPIPDAETGLAGHECTYGTWAADDDLETHSGDVEHNPGPACSDDGAGLVEELPPAEPGPDACHRTLRSWARQRGTGESTPEESSGTARRRRRCPVVREVQEAGMPQPAEEEEGMEALEPGVQSGMADTTQQEIILISDEEVNFLLEPLEVATPPREETAPQEVGLPEPGLQDCTAGAAEEQTMLAHQEQDCHSGRLEVSTLPREEMVLEPKEEESELPEANLQDYTTEQTAEVEDEQEVHHLEPCQVASSPREEVALEPKDEESELPEPYLQNYPGEQATQVQYEEEIYHLELCEATAPPREEVPPQPAEEEEEMEETEPCLQTSTAEQTTQVQEEQQVLHLEPGQDASPPREEVASQAAEEEGLAASEPSLQSSTADSTRRRTRSVPKRTCCSTAAPREKRAPQPAEKDRMEGTEPSLQRSPADSTRQQTRSVRKRRCQDASLPGEKRMPKTGSVSKRHHPSTALPREEESEARGSNQQSSTADSVRQQTTQFQKMPRIILTKIPEPSALLGGQHAAVAITDSEKVVPQPAEKGVQRTPARLQSSTADSVRKQTTVFHNGQRFRIIQQPSTLPTEKVVPQPAEKGVQRTPASLQSSTADSVRQQTIQVQRRPRIILMKKPPPSAPLGQPAAAAVTGPARWPSGLGVRLGFEKVVPQPAEKGVQGTPARLQSSTADSVRQQTTVFHNGQRFRIIQQPSTLPTERGLPQSAEQQLQAVGPSLQNCTANSAGQQPRRIHKVVIIKPGPVTMPVSTVPRVKTSISTPGGRCHRHQSPAVAEAAEVGGRRSRAKRMKRRKEQWTLKSIPSAAFKQQVSDTSDTTCRRINIAPPTKQLMRWKEMECAEKLLTMPGRPFHSPVLSQFYTRNLVTRFMEDQDDRAGVVIGVPPSFLVEESLDT